MTNVTVKLTAAQQKVALVLFARRQQVMQEAQRELDEVKAAVDELADLFARAAGADDGAWYFHQTGPGEEIVLRRAVEDDGLQDGADKAE